MLRRNASRALSSSSPPCPGPDPNPEPLPEQDYVAIRYHDGYLSIHFEANKYQDIELTPLQEEALWCAASTLNVVRAFPVGAEQWSLLCVMRINFHLAPLRTQGISAKP